MNRLNKPVWQHRVYERLADDLRAKQRYLDSVATLETFIVNNPLDRRAPVFNKRVIDTLIAADFPSEVRSRKEDFVTRYGVRSEFWTMYGEAERADYMPTLKEYLTELSRLSHSEAQKSHSPHDFLKAADYYEQFVATFPDDPGVADNLFLLGEVYTEAGDPARAVAAYQRVVHEHPDYVRANEAGYAAILGLDEVLKGRRRPRIVSCGSASRSTRRSSSRCCSPTIRARRTCRPRRPIRCISLGAVPASDGPGGPTDPHATESRSEARAHRVRDPRSRRVRTRSATRRRSVRIARCSAIPVATRRMSRPSTKSCWLRSTSRARRRSRAAQRMKPFATICASPTMLRVPNWRRRATTTRSPWSKHRGAGRKRPICCRTSRRAIPTVPTAQTRPNVWPDLYEKSESWTQAAAEYRALAGADGDAEVRRQALYRAGELYLQTQDTNGASKASVTMRNTIRNRRISRWKRCSTSTSCIERTGRLGQASILAAQEDRAGRTIGRHCAGSREISRRTGATGARGRCTRGVRRGRARRSAGEEPEAASSRR